MSGRWLRGRPPVRWLNDFTIHSHPFSTSFRKNGAAHQLQPSSATKDTLKRTRNIGIIAHIDAVCNTVNFLVCIQLNGQLGQNNHDRTHALL